MGTNRLAKTTDARRTAGTTPAREQELTVMAENMVAQIGHIRRAVRVELQTRPRAQWKKGLASIAAAAFSDAFAAVAAIEVLRNPKGHKMADRFLVAMRSELESREKPANAGGAR